MDTCAAQASSDLEGVVLAGWKGGELVYRHTVGRYHGPRDRLGDPVSTDGSAGRCAVGVSLFYAVVGTMLLPRLGLAPIGPMLKIWPLIVLNFLALVLVRRR